MASEKILQATGKSKDSLTSGQQMGVNLTGGLIAGMAAAVISQPADTLLSKINKSKGAPGQSTTSRLVQMSGQLGLKGLFTGMSARLVMIGTLTAGQCRSFGLWLVHLLIRPSLHLRRYQEGSQRHRWCMSFPLRTLLYTDKDRSKLLLSPSNFTLTIVQPR